jgi:hypothetical protein
MRGVVVADCQRGCSSQIAAWAQEPDDARLAALDASIGMYHHSSLWALGHMGRGHVQSVLVQHVGQPVASQLFGCQVVVHGAKLQTIPRHDERERCETVARW